MKNLKQKGFSIIELAITLSIAMIIIGFAIPSYEHVTTSSQINRSMRELQNALLLVRSEAVKRNQNVFLKYNSDWSDGWLVTTNIDRTYAECIADATADCVKVFQPVAGDMQVSTNVTATSLTYRRSGRPAVDLTFSLCPTNNAESFKQRVISLGTTGIPEITYGANCS